MRYFRFMLAAAAVTAITGCATQPSGSRISTGTGIRVAEVGIHNFSDTSDMWDRIRRGFGMPDLNNQIVRDKETYYTRRPEYMQRMIARSNKYIYYVVEQLELRNMPTELALLPFVESAFNPQAVSSAKAAGMWQFIPSTGRYFSLAQNSLRDDRRDVVLSTRAALDYLQKLYNMFGDWHLALAAYNWGEGSVQRAIDRNQAAGLGTGYEDLRMPNETREYVPKLQAIKNIISKPGVFNTVLPSVANHPYFDKVAITRDMDIDVAAQLAEISVSDFKALNPAMNKPVVIASVTPYILLPWESINTFLDNLAAAGDTPLTSRAIDSSDVADSSKQPTTVAAPATPSTASRTAAPARATTTVAANKTPEVVLRRSTITPRRGETIAQLAARYGLPAKTVAQWNKAGENQKLAANKPVVIYLPQLNRAKQQDDDSGKKTKGGKAQAASQKADKNTDKKSSSNKKQRNTRNDEDDQPIRSKKSAQSKADKNSAEKGKATSKNKESVKESSKEKNKGKAREAAKSSSKEAPKEKAASKKQPEKNAAKPVAKQKK